jgi:hypothetical protein
LGLLNKYKMVRKLRGTAIQAGTITVEQIAAGAVAANIAVYDEGNLIAQSATSVNFVGNTVAASAVGGNVTVNITAASGGTVSSYNFTYGNTAPVAPAPGDRWLESESLKEFVFADLGSTGIWIEPAGDGGIVGATGPAGIPGPSGNAASGGSSIFSWYMS